MLHEHRQPVAAEDLLARLQRLAHTRDIDVNEAVEALKTADVMRGRASGARKQGDDAAADALMAERANVRRNLQVTLEARRLLSIHRARAVCSSGAAAGCEMEGSGGSITAIEQDGWNPDTLPITYQPNAGQRWTATANVLWGAHARNDKVSSCLCPFHDDDTPSAFIGKSRRGRFFIHCSVCSTVWSMDDGDSVEALDTYCMDGEALRLLDLSKGPDITPQDNGSALATSSMSSRTGTSPSYREQDIGKSLSTSRKPKGYVTFNRRYIGSLDTPAQVTYVRSPKDSGKTYALNSKLASEPDARVLVITHRRSLAQKAFGDLANQGFVLYLDAPHGHIHAPRVIVCLDSICRIPVTVNADEGPLLNRFDYVVIDESEQVIQHLDGHTITSMEPVVTRLSELMRYAHHVILLDADLGELTFTTTRILMGWKTAGDGEECLIENRYQPALKVRFYDELEALDVFRHQCWQGGERLAIFCTTKAEAKRLARQMEDENPGRRIVLVTSETSEQLVDFLRDVNRHVADEENPVDALIYSPSMGTGVSIDVIHHFDRVLAYMQSGDFTTAHDAVQGPARIRNPRDPELHVWVGKARFEFETDPLAIRHNLLFSREGDTKLVVKHHPSRLLHVYGTFFDEDALDILVQIRRARRLGQNHLRYSVQHYYEARNAAVSCAASSSTDEMADMALARTGLRTTISREEAQAILDAPAIDIREARQIMKTSASLQERRQARRAFLTEFFGSQVTLDLELVTEATNGELKVRVKRFASHQIMAEEHAESLASMQFERYNREGVRTEPFLLETQVRAWILACYGINVVDGKAAGAILDRPSPDVLERMLKAAPEIKRILGVAVPSNLHDQPFKFLAMVLRQIGVGGKSPERRTVAGEKRTRGYRLDPGTVVRMQSLSAACAERMKNAPTLQYRYSVTSPPTDWIAGDGNGHVRMDASAHAEAPEVGPSGTSTAIDGWMSPVATWTYPPMAGSSSDTQSGHPDAGSAWTKTPTGRAGEIDPVENREKFNGAFRFESACSGLIP